MPRIYVTCRTQDSAHSKYEHVYARLAEAFGTDNVLRTAGSGSADGVYLAELVHSCDALVVVTGTYWLNMLDESGRRLLEDPLDYHYTELATALEDDDKWVTLLLVDGTTAPEPDELPFALQGLLRRDRVRVAHDDELDAALDSLIERIQIAGAHQSPQARQSASAKVKASAGAASPAAHLAPMTRRERMLVISVISLVILVLMMCSLSVATGVSNEAATKTHRTEVVREMHAINAVYNTQTKAARLPRVEPTGTFDYYGFGISPLSSRNAAYCAACSVVPAVTM